MLQARIIPVLLLHGAGIVKTTRFDKSVYIGDPINIVKIFNEKCVDELVILDISATTENKGIQFDLISRIAAEAFMPLCYGGGIKSIEDMRTIFNLGYEKVSLNSQAVDNPGLIEKAGQTFGSQSIVVSIDVKKNFFGNYEVVTHSGKRKSNCSPVDLAIRMEKLGAGELLINSVDRDGTMSGYDIGLIRKVSQAVGIPVIACGGAGAAADLGKAINEGGASAAAAGSMFVFYGKHRAVLITVPGEEELTEVGVLK